MCIVTSIELPVMCDDLHLTGFFVGETLCCSTGHFCTVTKLNSKLFLIFVAVVPCISNRGQTKATFSFPAGSLLILLAEMRCI